MQGSGRVFEAEVKYSHSVLAPLHTLKITNVKDITITKESGETIVFNKLKI